RAAPLVRHALARWRRRSARCAGIVRSCFRYDHTGVHRSGPRALAGSASPLSSQALDHVGTVACPGGWMSFDHFSVVRASKGRLGMWGALVLVLAASTARAQDSSPPPAPAPTPAPKTGFRPRVVREGTLAIGMQGEYGTFLGTSGFGQSFNHGPSIA